MRQFESFIRSRKPASARSTFSLGGRLFLISSKVVRGRSANETMASQPSGMLTEATQEGASILFYGEKHQPMWLRSSKLREEAIQSSVFSPDSPIQTGTSYLLRKSTYS